MQTLKNYALGQWVEGTGKTQTLFHAVTGEAIAVFLPSSGRYVC